ncbi:retrovirus-related pol polyprotein from transposon TNT 1-94 [Tanacetum coccineum]
MNDDTSMCERHEVNSIQSEGYQIRDSHDSYSHQSYYDPKLNNDSEKSLIELNNDVKNDLEHFKSCIRSMRTVHDKLFDRDDGKTTGVLPKKKSKIVNQEPQSKTDLEKSITNFLDGQRVSNMSVKNNVNDMILKMKQNEKNFQTKFKNTKKKIDEWSKSQNVSSEQTNIKDPPPPPTHTEQVNAVFTGCGESDDSLKIQKDPPPPITVNNKIRKDNPIKTSKRAITWSNQKSIHFVIGMCRGIKRKNTRRFEALTMKFISEVRRFHTKTDALLFCHLVHLVTADRDIKATNIILQGLPPEVYALSPKYGSSYQSQQYSTNQSSTPLSISYPSNDYQSSVHHNVYSPSPSIPQLEYAPTVNQQPTQPKFPQLDSGLTVLVFKQGDDPIDAINHMMSFLSAVITSRYPTTNNQLRNSPNPRQQATINDGKVTLQPVQGRTIICYNCKGEGHMSKQCTKPKRKRDDTWFKDKVLLVQAQAYGQILHEEELAFLADPGIVEVALMAHLSHYGSDVLAEVHNPDNMDKNMINQGVQAGPSFEQSSVAAVQNSNSSVQQDTLILSMIEQLKTQVINCPKINLDNKSVNDTLTAELERYKEQVKVLKEGQNVDLKTRDNVSDSCKQSVEIDCLKQTLSEQLKEKESLMQTVTLLKNDFKKEESRNIDREIALKKKIKQLDNIVYKRDQSAQTKAQKLEPKLYDGNVIKSTSAIVILDSEETLMLAEESQPTVSNFEKLFVPQTELSAEQAFWSQNSMILHIIVLLVDPPKSRMSKKEPRPQPSLRARGGFEHTKAYLRDGIIPFLKALKDIFNTFDQYLIDELTEVQNVFHQMEHAIKQHRLESKTFEVKMNQVLNKNE